MNHNGKTFDRNYSTLLLATLIIPTALLTLGIYHGFVQTLYRAGIIRSNSLFGLNYYQGLTLHGVVNAIVFTTFFAVAFGNLLIPYYLSIFPNRKVSWLSFGLMLVGTLVAAAAILSGQASVLYTFYPPLKAHVSFYAGATVLVIGSWLAFFSWIPPYVKWRKQNPTQKTPMAVLGIFSAFIVWFLCTIPLAVEILFMLIPWSVGWVDSIDVTLAKTLFWFFGHPLVYFWLLPAYTMFYVMLPRLAGGKLFSDAAGRLSFFLFIIFSCPVGLHHQYTDPAISAEWKWFHGLLTFCVAIPSFLTAFTLSASMEYGAREKGGKGLFSWWSKLPYFSTENWLFGYFFCGLVLFLFGGITGIINASPTINLMVHNTAWIPGHFHTTLGGPVYLSFIGMTLFLCSQLLGKKVAFPKLNVAVPYLWLFGVAIFSTGLSLGGLRGEPRRTNSGLTYLDPSHPAFQPSWKITTLLGAIGGAIMFLSAIVFFIVFFTTLFKKQDQECAVTLPDSESLHDEDVSYFKNLTPWVVTAVLLMLLSYYAPLKDILNAKAEKSGRFRPDSPVKEMMK